MTTRPPLAAPGRAPLPPPRLHDHPVREVHATAREPNGTRYHLDALEHGPARRALTGAVAHQPRLGPIERLHRQPMRLGIGDHRLTTRLPRTHVITPRPQLRGQRRFLCHHRVLLSDGREHSFANGQPE